LSREEIIMLAHQLGDAVKRSDEIQAVMDVQGKLQADKEASNLVMRYQDVKNQIENKMRDGLAITEVDKNHLKILEQQLNNNSIVSELISVQKKFENLMEAVYFAMNQAISGGCSSDCSSCGGNCGI